MKSYVERICKKLISVSLVATSYPNNELEFTEGGLDRMKYRRDFQSRRLSLKTCKILDKRDCRHFVSAIEC